MSFKDTLLCVCMFFASFNYAYASGDAMFGLTWGESIEKVKQRGVVFLGAYKSENLTVVKTTSLPKNISNTASYLLLFHDKKGLVRMRSSSNKIENDIDGSVGKQQFEKLSDILTKKYIKEHEYKDIGGQLANKPDEFYQCLAVKCEDWSAFFVSKNKKIILTLEGLERATGYITILIESPEWHDISEANEHISNVKDADAL